MSKGEQKKETNNHFGIEIFVDLLYSSRVKNIYPKLLWQNVGFCLGCIMQKLLFLHFAGYKISM